MLLRLDFSSGVPIYRQIHDQLVLGIADGRLKAGEKLPSVRSLASEAGVNMMTVSKAYGTLKAEGHILTDRRGGTVVAGCADKVGEETLLNEIRLPAAEAKLSGMARDKWLELCGLAYDGKKEDESL
ncbi:MAG: GntR family transcriptional regulator [Oscillospiraceae bacterium]|nr:GntR family transcriptional regulator [Oscillospiraceae bacterium]